MYLLKKTMVIFQPDICGAWCFSPKAFEPYRVRLPNIGNHLSLFWFTPNAGVDSS